MKIYVKQNFKYAELTVNKSANLLWMYRDSKKSSHFSFNAPLVNVDHCFNLLL